MGTAQDGACSTSAETSASARPASFAADLDEFLELHHEHGRFTPTVGELTPNGYRVEVACPCGVTFARWVTPEDAMEDVLRGHLPAWSAG